MCAYNSLLHKLSAFLPVFLILLLSVAAVAEPGKRGAQQRLPESTKKGPAAGGRHLRQEPCWKQVGIAKGAMEKRRSIAESARSQEDAVCTDSSLTLQQKRAKIREIRRAADEQMQGLISPQQRDALKQCQLARRNGKPAGAGAAHAALHHPRPAPCGNL